MKKQEKQDDTFRCVICNVMICEREEERMKKNIPPVQNVDGMCWKCSNEYGVYRSIFE